MACQIFQMMIACWKQPIIAKILFKIEYDWHHFLRIKCYTSPDETSTENRKNAVHVHKKTWFFGVSFRCLTFCSAQSLWFCRPSSRRRWAGAILWAGRSPAGRPRPSARPPRTAALGGTCPSALKKEINKSLYKFIIMLMKPPSFLRVLGLEVMTITIQVHTTAQIRYESDMWKVQQ